MVINYNSVVNRMVRILFYKASVHLTNVLLGRGCLERTIYCSIWKVIFICFTLSCLLLFFDHYHTVAQRWRAYAFIYLVCTTYYVVPTRCYVVPTRCYVVPTRWYVVRTR